MEDGFCDFGWSKKFGWNIYIYVCARVPTTGMKLLVLNLVFVQFRGNYREIYRNTGEIRVILRGEIRRGFVCFELQFLFRGYIAEDSANF